MAADVEPLRKRAPVVGDGLAAAVYTQTTDVETEAKGLMTHDRTVIKLPAARLRELAVPL